MKGLMLRRETTSPFRRGGPQLGLAALLSVAAVATPRAWGETLVDGSPQQNVAQTVQAAAQQQAAADYAKKVQDLISKTEASYRAGVDAYNANRLDAARMNFDAAVDMMLASGIDLKNDPELSDEFDQLLSRINSLELIALKQGNGFSPKVEEAPIEDANEVTFTPDAAVANRVAAEVKTTGSDLPLVNNEYVAGWVDAFANKPGLRAHLVHSLERAGRYQAMIQRVLKQYDVPQDLIYQAVTESGFQPQSLNRRSGAGGMWQFMPFASSYGLVRNGYFDERFDPEKSTIAYAKYMKMLYGLFGDWYLAMAAYDWGPGRVQQVVSRTGYADYWEIYRHGGLPAETKAYIPSVIAAIIVAKNPQQYGLTDLKPDPPILSDTVTTDYAIDLHLVADITDSTVSDIVALNPALLRLATPGDIPYDLHIPNGTLQQYTDRLQNIPEEHRASWRFHVVRPGETLDQIAENMHSHVSEIAAFNELKSSQPIEEGDELVIPVAAVAALRGPQRYMLRRNDTLVTVADRFGVTVEQLREWNHLTSSRVAPGRSLYVSEPIRLAPTSRAARGLRTRNTTHSAGAKGTAHASTHAVAGKGSKAKKRAR